MMIKRATKLDKITWLSLRNELWPESSDLNSTEIEDILCHPEKSVGFIAWEQNDPVGFVEVSLRKEYVEGVDYYPVGYLEGIYVRRVHRRKGVAKRLIQAVEVWCKNRGCREIASDAHLNNTVSDQLHKTLGFHEVARNIHYLKRLL